MDDEVDHTKASNRSPRWAFMQTLRIPSQRDPESDYLVRLRLIQTPVFGIYLHRIYEPDGNRALHDHPWNFVSIILRGHYAEIRDWSGRSHVVKWINRKKATDFHQIVWMSRTPVWTLMLVGKRQREWGFQFRDGSWVPWTQSPTEDVYKQRTRPTT